MFRELAASHRQGERIVQVFLLLGLGQDIVPLQELCLREIPNTECPAIWGLASAIIPKGTVQFLKKVLEQTKDPFCSSLD